jgi:FkbH-like protein
MSSQHQIAVLCSFNLDLVKRPLQEALAGAGIDVEVYLTGYGLWQTEPLDPGSALNRFSPDVAIVFVDAADILAPLEAVQFGPPSERSSAVGRVAWKRVEAAVNGLLAHLPPEAIVLVHNLSRPAINPLGILEDSGGYSLGAAVDAFNEQLRSLAESSARVRVIDYAGFVAEHGHAALCDNRLWQIGRMRFGRAGLTKLSGLYQRYLAALFTPRRKVLVLDLDNTLWGGVLGEDGVDGIAIGQEGIGLAYREFQLAIRALARRGVVLAIASKNNSGDAWEVIDRHPEMVLRRRDFACAEIHWSPKSESLPRIAQQLNLGLDSLVFWDDEPREREIVRSQHPSVLVPEVPTDPTSYARAILELPCFDVISLTEEDRRRGEMYRQELDRQQWLSEAAPADLSEFYRSLNMIVTIARPDEFGVARIAQLTQRTNQFNFTTRRYTEGDIRSKLADPSCGLYTVSLEDRFGKLGVVGAAIVEQDGAAWRLDTFLMSCRALGRGVEDAFLATLIREATRAHAELAGRFIPTTKNAPTRQFLERLNVPLEAAGEGGVQFRLHSGQIGCPEWINLREGNCIHA